LTWNNLKSLSWLQNNLQSLAWLETTCRTWLNLK
jgi:hypothetical protein